MTQACWPIHTKSFETRIRFEYGLTVIGLRHGNKAVMHALIEETLKIGDILLLTGFWSDKRSPHRRRGRTEHAG